MTTELRGRKCTKGEEGIEMTSGSGLGDWMHGDVLADRWHATDNAGLGWKVSLFLTIEFEVLVKYPNVQYNNGNMGSELKRKRENTISNF